MSGYKAYQGQQIEGSGPLGLVVLSYDALYKALGRARLAIESNDLAQEADHTARAMEAIIELSSSLDFDKGEEISINLSRLYQYMMDKLAGHMCSGKTAHVTEVMELVQTLREGWQQLAQQQSQPAAAKPEATQASKSEPHHAYNSNTGASRLSGYAA